MQKEKSDTDLVWG